MSRNSLGQYIEHDSIVHKIDARLKIVLLIIFSLIIFLTTNTIKLFLLTFFIILLLILPKIKIKNTINSLKSFLFAYIFIIIMYYFFAKDKIIDGIFSLWRFVLLILLSLILTSTTTLSQLVNSIEKLAAPLKYFKINPRNIALMLSAAIRFIPLFFLYAQRIKEAQYSRLSDFKKPKNIITFLNKIILRMVNSAITLSESMEARCYSISNQKHTSYKALKITKIDYMAAFVFLLFAAGILLSK